MQPQQEKAELDALLSSEAFTKSPNLAKLLKYICTKYFEGNSGYLKEYNIGVEAMGRPPDFDPSTNSIVRVEVHRLREKLKKYYETEGASHSTVITLDVGRYVPHFVARAEASPKPALQGAVPSGGERKEGDLEARQSTPPRGPRRTWEFTLRVPGRPAIRLGHAWARLLVALLPLIFVAGILVWRQKPVRPERGTLASSGLGGPEVAASAGFGQEVRVLAGHLTGDYIDHAAQTWVSDRYYSGGTALSGGPRFIDRTSDPALYQTCRSGEFGYDIPLKPGVYELRLYFAETVYGSSTLAGGGESSRVFNAEVNGKPILNEFDPLADAGAPNTADVRVVTDVTPAPDGKLHLRFSRFRGPTPPQDEPMLNALEIVPGIPEKMRPVRIVAQTNSFVDHMGRRWSPDHYASQGRLVLHNRPVDETPDPGLYYGERFGHFSYAIPVAKGLYTLSLHFAETYFGPQNPAGGGAGSRLFDVYCNGLRILHNFDIFKEAGGSNRGLAKTFHHLEPSPQGKLLLTFVPIRNYACLSAIELINE